MPIKILDEHVIAQIAAGEVVERPASVAKELIENALDAHAKTITIETQDGGKRLIRVSDDGTGIPNAEMPLAILRHATSKLDQTEDLYRIQTLGFRGEALASIIAVSRATLISRHRDESIGTQLVLEGGTLIAQKAVGAPVGTILSVEHLFYNTPARLKFLKGEATEKRQIQQLIQRYAMAYPHVRFILIQDGRELFRSSGSGNLADVAVHVFGLDDFKHMLEVKSSDAIHGHGGKINIYGYVSPPDLHRKDRSQIILFINGRAVQDKNLTYAVTQAYHPLLEGERHPMAVLLIEVPPDYVDVNVHPTKAEVRFQDANTVFMIVQRSVRQVILRFVQGNTHTISSPYQDDSTRSETATKQQKRDQHTTSETSLLDEQPSSERPQIAIPDDKDPRYAIPEGLGRPIKPRTLPPLRVVGQIGASYIITEGPAGMYLIDQHAAHFRVQYDTLLDLIQEHDSLPSQALEGRTLTVSTAHARLLETHQALLKRLGFQVEAFGTQTVMIRTIPNLLSHMNAAEALSQLLPALKTADEMQLLVLIAELAAIKSGHILSTDEMRGLVKHLERCRDPHSAPNGQATILHMSAEQISREFKRRD